MAVWMEVVGEAIPEASTWMTPAATLAQVRRNTRVPPDNGASPRRRFFDGRATARVRREKWPPGHAWQEGEVL